MRRREKEMNPYMRHVRLVVFRFPLSQVTERNRYFHRSKYDSCVDALLDHFSLYKHEAIYFCFVFLSL